MKHYVFLNSEPDIEKSDDVIIYYFGNSLENQEKADVHVNDLPERAFYAKESETVKFLTTTLEEVYFKGIPEKKMYDLVHTVKLKVYTNKFFFRNSEYLSVYNPVSGLKISSKFVDLNDILDIMKHGIHHLLIWIACGFQNKKMEAIPSWALQTESVWLGPLISFYEISPKNSLVPDKQFDMNQALIPRDCRFDILQNEDLRFTLCEGTMRVLKKFSLENNLTSVFDSEDHYSTTKWLRILARLEKMY